MSVSLRSGGLARQISWHRWAGARFVRDTMAEECRTKRTSTDIARATDYFLEAIAADLTYASAREATRDTPELSRR